MLSSKFLSLALALPALVHAAVFTNPSHLPYGKTYDYIVIGSGAGGATVAGRLSENRLVNVLLIEAGVTNEGVLNSEVPFLVTSLAPNTPFTWNYTTTDQPGLFNRSITYPRGKMLGGSTGVNFMVYTRTAASDFNRLANISGDSGWSYESLLPYMLKNERLVNPTDNHDITGQITPSIHGKSGPVSITVANSGIPLDARVINTTQQLSDEFSFTVDYNAGTELGVGWLQSSNGGGSRSSSAVAYVNPRSSQLNFDVLIQTQVTKLIQTGVERGKPAFRGVQFAQSASAPHYTLKAKKEVILSAGSVATPQVLMLSGIGPKDELTSFGIKTIVDLPVGQNMQDHPLLANQWLVQPGSSDDDLFRGRQPDVFNSLLEQWQTNKTGRMADIPANQIGFFRLPSNASIFENVTDPSSGSDASHYEFLWINFFASYAQAVPDTGSFLTIATVVSTPTSRGSITLASTDPFAFPLVNPNMLSTDFDIFTMREAVKAAKRFVTAPAWSDYVIGPAPGQFSNTDTDELLDAWIRNTTTTIWHPVSTAPMSPCGASTGVVDPDLHVKGVVGLRVVDASVIPIVPSGHTQAPVYFVAERAADLIKNGSAFCA